MRTSFIILLLVFLVGWILPAQAQIQQAGDRGYFFNNSTVTLKTQKLLKADTTMAVFVYLDTCNSLYTAHDTAGNATTTTLLGTKNKKALMSDTLQGNPGAPFFIMASAISNSSTDTLFISGKKATNPVFDKYDSTNAIDTLNWSGTVTPANSERWSKYLWTRIDSFRIRTAAAGLDTITTWYRPFFGMTLADSLTGLCSGVLLGGNQSGTNDSVATKKWGYYIKRGMAQVYASGATVRIKYGDALVVGNNGKAIPANYPRIDTVNTLATTFGLNRKYVPGAKAGDFVIVSKLGKITSAIDTLGWKGYASNDSIWIVPSTIAGGGSAVDSLVYLYIPRGMTGLAALGVGMKLDLDSRIIGRALQQCTTDSTKIWMDYKR